VIWRVIVVWLAVLVLASLNGAAREAWLIPRFGDPVGRAVSTVILCALVYLTTWLTIGWIHPTRASEALGIGALWLALTLAFEFLAGHYAFGKDWAVLLEDYDLSRGRIWVMVLIVVLLAPLWTARIRGLLGAQGSG
jgi:hypothetical protein